MVAQFDDQGKDRIRKAFQRCFWSWSLPIRKRVVWRVKRLLRERRGNGKVEMEVGFVDQCVESDAEPMEQLVDVAEELPNVVDEIGFHDQLVESNMEIVEHLVVDNQVVIDIDVAGVDSPVSNVIEDLHDTADLYVPNVELLVVDMAEDLMFLSLQI